MNIDNALAELRAAFPRVRWVLRPTCVSAYRDDGNLLLLVAPQDDCWIANCATGWVSAQAPNPVSAARAWLAAQPTAAFYPAPPIGETVEVRGFVVVNAAGEYHARGPSWGTYESEWGARNAEETFGVNCEDALSRRSDAIPFIVRVPVPVDPPVLVGEVIDV